MKDKENDKIVQKILLETYLNESKQNIIETFGKIKVKNITEMQSNDIFGSVGSMFCKVHGGILRFNFYDFLDYTKSIYSTNFVEIFYGKDRKHRIHVVLRSLRIDLGRMDKLEPKDIEEVTKRFLKSF